MNTNQLIYLFFFCLCSCFQHKESNQNIIFQIPEIQNSAFDSTKYIRSFKANHISETFPIFVGKFKFQEKIDLNPEKRDTSFYKDFNTSFTRGLGNDTLSINGFELYVDYNSSAIYEWYDTLVYEYYPVYFVNSTDSDKLFLGKDSYTFGLQEAAMANNRWQTIEAQGFDFCGNGYWSLIVHPKEFVVILMQKYQGDFKTTLRTRFRIGETVYVSHSYKGTINQNQFNYKEDSYIETKMKENPVEAINHYFYGSPYYPKTQHK